MPAPHHSMTYQQSVLKRYHSDKYLSELLPTRWRQKSTAMDVEQNYVTVTLCICITALYCTDATVTV